MKARICDKCAITITEWESYKGGFITINPKKWLYRKLDLCLNCATIFRTMVGNWQYNRNE